MLLVAMSFDPPTRWLGFVGSIAMSVSLCGPDWLLAFTFVPTEARAPSETQRSARGTSLRKRDADMRTADSRTTGAANALEPGLRRREGARGPASAPRPRPSRPRG